jgi:hypothetical protein
MTGDEALFNSIQACGRPQDVDPATANPEPGILAPSNLPRPRLELGFEVRTDATMDNGFRWVTVSPKAQPDLEIALM